jgi:hypothetical protein
VLAATCNGEHTVCLCKLDGGCGDVAKGAPVGVLDVNQDGAADDTRMIQGAVGIQCGNIEVPVDVNNSYWNPSGDQNRPAMGGFDALGPALVVAPTGALPTSQTCEFTFAPDIVDKTNVQLCAPPGGDVTKTCTPGDTSVFKFATLPLTVSNQSFGDGDTGVDRAAPVIIVASAPVAMGSLGAVSVKQGATNFTGFTVLLPQPQTIRINWTSPLAANTTYTITISTALTDTYGQPLTMTTSYTFTTGA